MSDKKIPQKAPFVIECEAGRYSWCSCGLSSKQPYCDGSHKGTGMTPIKIILEEKKTVAWCGCKHSNNGVFCDGSHNKLD